ncbi:MAG: transglutaminase family protein [Armatimonas sp.]
MYLTIRHLTRYVYQGEASDSLNEVRMQPLMHDEDQHLLSFTLATSPQAKLFHYDLPWGRVHHFGVRDPHAILEIETHARVRTCLSDPFLRMNLAVEDDNRYDSTMRSANYEWLLPTARVPHDDPSLADELDALIAEARKNADGPTTSHFLVALTGLLHREFPYAPGDTNVDTTLREVLTLRRGVCQDTAHLFLALARRAGIPSRYVSGYLYTGHGLTSNDRMHAWIECLVPNAYGSSSQTRWLWRGFDPTNNLVAGKSYIKVHRGRDYADVSPNKGIFWGLPTERLDIEVEVFAEDSTS